MTERQAKIFRKFSNVDLKNLRNKRIIKKLISVVVNVFCEKKYHCCLSELLKNSEDFDISLWYFENLQRFSSQKNPISPKGFSKKIIFIFQIPENDPLGPAVISLFLDECPLPSRESVQTLLLSLGLSSEFVDSKHLPPSWHKNMCIVLGSLAEKMAGSAAVTMFNDKIKGYLMKIICYGLTYFPPNYGKTLVRINILNEDFSTKNKFRKRRTLIV